MIDDQRRPDPAIFEAPSPWAPGVMGVETAHLHAIIPPDAVVEIPEAEYAYGIGTLRLRVVAAHVMHDRAGWVWVAGHEVSWSGRVSTAPRGVLVTLAWVQAWRRAHPPT